MAYSTDLRQRVMDYLSKGRTQKEAAQIYAVSTSAIKEWKKLLAETGSVKKRELNRKPRKYTSEKMIEIITETPDAYLSEIASKFERGSESGVRKALKRMKLARKKRR